MPFVRNQIFDRCDDVTETSGENVGVTQDPRTDTSALPFWHGMEWMESHL